jgi:hypothetical protein
VKNYQHILNRKQFENSYGKINAYYYSGLEKQKGVCMFTFIIFEIIYFFTEFQALSDGDVCKSKCSPYIAGPRIKQQ